MSSTSPISLISEIYKSDEKGSSIAPMPSDKNIFVYSTTTNSELKKLKKPKKKISIKKKLVISLEPIEEELTETKTINGNLVKQFQEIQKELIGADLKKIKTHIEQTLLEEQADLVKQFKKDFEKFPKDNILRIEVLRFLSDLGVKIT